MELTDSFLTLLQNFDSGLHSPDLPDARGGEYGLQILSQRHRYVTEIIFSSGHVDTGIGAGSTASSAMPPGTRRLLHVLGQVGRPSLAPGATFSGPSTTPSVANAG